MVNFVSYIPHLLSPMFLGYLKGIAESIASGGGIFLCIQSEILNLLMACRDLIPADSSNQRPQFATCPPQTQSDQPSLGSSNILCCLFTILRPSDWARVSDQRAYPLSSLTRFAQLQLLLLCAHPAHHFSKRPPDKGSVPPSVPSASPSIIHK